MLVQRGANGNVFGYNFSINATSDGTISPFNRITDGSLHGHFPYMNLYEGNVMQEIHSADQWGPSGNGNTFFRNRITREGIQISDRSIEQNIVGNDLRKDATATFTSDIITNEPGVINTLIHGNKENNTVTWDPNLGSNNLINSYYLSGAPVFFNGYSWPCLGPEAQYSSGTIPAEVRFANGYDTECENPVATSANEISFERITSVYPNPANEFLTIKYELKQKASVKIQLVSMLGQIMNEVDCRNQSAGANEIKFDIKNNSPGIYFLLMNTDEKRVSSEKIILQINKNN